MADERITNELIYEVLKGIQGELVRMNQRLDSLEAEMRIVRQHIAALVQSDMQRGTQIADLEARVARIEKRLELTNGGEG
ncbi:MAG: hypothetical protein AAF744_14715 [Pseudomonadota bacterium]